MNRIFVGGLPHSSAIAWEVAKLCRTSEHSLKLLVPHAHWAYDLRDDLAVLYPTLKVLYLPALESDLLRNRGPSLLHRMERIRFFSYLFNSIEADTPKLFIFSTEALTQRSPRPQFWTENLYKIKTNTEISRSEVSEKLVLFGYTPTELVESKTEFAVRGSIVDFFSPLYEYPIRVELYGDEVQSIRLFHPESQRTMQDLNEACLVPAREFLYPDTAASLDEVKRRIRTAADALDWQKKDRDALLERIQQRIFFPTVDYWAPIIQPENFLSEPPDSQFVADISVEAHVIENEFKIQYRQTESNFLAARVEQEWIPEASTFLAPSSAGEKIIRESLQQSSWLSTRKLSGLALEPKTKIYTDIRTQDRLADKLAAARAQTIELPLTPFKEEVRLAHEQNYTTVILGASTSQLERLLFLAQEYSLSFKIFSSLDEILKARPVLAALVGTLEQAFIDPKEKISFILDEQILGTKRKKRATKSTQKVSNRSVFSADFALLDLKPNDLVVHAEHGIGRYLGLKTINFQGIYSELVEIEYREGNKLLVPVTRLSVIQKYSANGGTEVALDRMGGQSWENKKTRAKSELQSIAGDLLHLYSKRELARGPEIAPSEADIDKFAATFAYVETPDQEQAIQATLKDLRGPKPMDRLICGDVGYGKTEVAIRAAHAAVACGFQVAVLVPTTILSAQHEATFKKRLTPLGFKIEGISRFRSAREAKESLRKLKSGELDILIGTHRLLGSDVSFANLGILIIDEEQKFGVVHKEKLKKFRTNVHILSMTATPIPRTLNMAMSGLKELSVITTPPQDRLSVRTHVARSKGALIQEAIQNELKRGGQVFFVHNRVQSIGKVLEELKKLVPAASIEFVHGQMQESMLEERMINFYEGRTQVLLTTSIIESGLDVPNANTLIVDRADMFGLAQLYQMRGRVGRSNVRAYAYFLLPESGAITQDAEERLGVLESYQELGSGFHIASHDLEIRGSGEMLGRSQSGQIAAIGFDTYVQLLQECIAELKGEIVEQKIDPEISLGIDTTLPDNYIPEIGLRLMFYRKLAASLDEHEVDATEKEMDDRFGVAPPSAKNLISVMRIKCQLRRLGVKSLNAGKNGFSVFFDASTPVNPTKLVDAVKKYPAHFQMSPEGRLFLRRPEDSKDPETILRGVEGALTQLESWCG